MSHSDIQSSQPSQLPVASYFDEAIYAQEQARIFAAMPRYVGHALSVSEVGDYHCLQQESQGRALLHSQRGIELISNVCRHRQAIMLKDRGKQQGVLVCPLHRWSYDVSGAHGPSGQLLGAPHFAQDPCLHLNNYPLQNWQGLLFEGGPDVPDIGQHLGAMQAAPHFDFSNYVYERTELHWCNYNWKTFIEVYLEDLHVGPFHPGLGQFVTCDDLLWEMGQHYSVQTVGVARGLQQPGSPVYQRWHEAVLAQHQGQPPQCGAVWLTYYPNVMVEWYPKALVVSSLFPHGPQKTLNMVEFFYTEDIAAFERDYIEAQYAAYMETCDEDDEIAERMDAGRLALYQRGDDEHGPYQSPMEDGMQHFHLWYRRMMGL